MKRGDDFILDGVHLLTVVADDGRVFGLLADCSIDGTDTGREISFSVSDGVVSMSTLGYDFSVAGTITIFDTDGGDEYACPEVLDWLCRNYGLSFSPAGLYLYESASKVATYAATSAACIQNEGGNVFVIDSAQDDYGLAFPSGSATVLGCEGSAVPNSIDATVVPSGSLEAIRSETAAEYRAAYNTWLFYLASGLPKSVFENL